MIRELMFSVFATPVELLTGHVVSIETQRGRRLITVRPNRGLSVDVGHESSKSLLGYLDAIAVLSRLGEPECNWKNVKNGKSDVLARRIYSN